MATVKAIPPQSKESSLKKVAAYCRVSTKSREQLDSLAAKSAIMKNGLGQIQIGSLLGFALI